MVIVREISEDVYVASEYTVGDDTAVALKIITRKASEKVIRFAFEFAKSQGRRKVTAIHKANVLKQTDGLFVKVAREIAQDYPHVEFGEEKIDAACALVVARPALFDVVVMPNQYGDIMSDLCSSAAGSLGLGAGRYVWDGGIPLRTRAWLGTGHRREGYCQPCITNTERGADAQTLEGRPRGCRHRACCR